ncbi:MAG: hypothetical protein H6Q59_3150 [Firmicutes bacterium]|nr:hypothetical protein [Bacillota bacterium]
MDCAKAIRATDATWYKFTPQNIDRYFEIN